MIIMNAIGRWKSWSKKKKTLYLLLYYCYLTVREHMDFIYGLSLVNICVMNNVHNYALLDGMVHANL